MARERIAIDFDSDTTKIYKSGNGLVLCEHTVVAVDDADKQIKAFGNDARKLIGKTAMSTRILAPVSDGEIVNEKYASALLSHFLRKIGVISTLTPVECVMSVPCGITAEMLYKYEKVAKTAGITKLKFVEAPILSAFGQRLPITDANPYFLIDMAGGVTNIATISLDGIIAGLSVNIGSNKLTADIMDYLGSAFNIKVGVLTAERVKNEIGSLDDDDELSIIINGSDAVTGRPMDLSLKAKDIIPPVKKYFDKIGEIAMDLLTKLPPEVTAEIRSSGIFLSGVCTSVYGLEKYYTDKFEMPVRIADNAAMVVALGGGVLVSDVATLKKLAVRTE